jgi:hypothetical protein
MRVALRFALAVFVALGAADGMRWLLTQHANPLELVRDALVALVGFAVVFFERDRLRLVAALPGALAVELLYLVVYVSRTSWSFEPDRLWNPELYILALARGFGIFLAGRGERRWIDGLLVAVPVIVADFILTAVSSLRALGEYFSVGAVTPHLGQMLASGAVVAVLLPLVAGRQRKPAKT